jgi:hypothetical protein
MSPANVIFALAQERDGNISDLKSRIIRACPRAPDELLSLLHRLLQGSADWRDFKDGGQFERYGLDGIRRLAAWCAGLRTRWQREKSCEPNEQNTTCKADHHEVEADVDGKDHVSRNVHKGLSVMSRRGKRRAHSAASSI